MSRNDKKTEWIGGSLGFLLVLWMSLRMAPYLSDGLVSFLPKAGEIFSPPFGITFCENSLRTVFLLELAYLLALACFFSGRESKRTGEEHGSARWGDAPELGKKYDPGKTGKILTENVSMALSDKEHRRNLNTLVCGGSGAGKTRFFAKPNILQAVQNGSSLVLVDPNE